MGVEQEVRPAMPASNSKSLMVEILLEGGRVGHIFINVFFKKKIKGVNYCVQLVYEK